MEENENDIVFGGDTWKVPDNPSVPFVYGDGIGHDVTSNAMRVIDAAVEKAYGGSRSIKWIEMQAGEKAEKEAGTRLPDSTIEYVKKHGLLFKGPLETPVGGGFRSLNVTLRLALDLYANIRPIKYVKGITSPLRNPDNIDLVIFRENTDDIYIGIEWKYDSKEAGEVRDFLKSRMGVKIDQDAGIGIKPIGKAKTERIARMAIRYAIKNKRRSVTIMHKGNIMKYTEGAFREWSYDVAVSEFRDSIVTEKEVAEKYGGRVPEGKVLINDRIADNMFQQLIGKPDIYDVILAPNLNGDYVSDAAGALIGDIGILGGANIGDNGGMFEAVHGTAPKYADKNIANPMGMIRAGMLMLEYFGWNEPVALIDKAMEKSIAQKEVTQDIARLMGCEAIGTREFSDAVIGNL